MSTTPNITSPFNDKISPTTHTHTHLDTRFFTALTAFDWSHLTRLSKRRRQNEWAGVSMLTTIWQTLENAQFTDNGAVKGEFQDCGKFITYCGLTSLTLCVCLGVNCVYASQGVVVFDVCNYHSHLIMGYGPDLMGTVIKSLCFSIGLKLRLKFINSDLNDFSMKKNFDQTYKIVSRK